VNAPVAVGLTLLVLTTGCSAVGGGDDDEGSSDCAVLIKADGVVFSSVGVTSTPAVELGTAQQSSCHDVGEDAPGPVFDDSSATITTYRITGYAPDQVLGTRATNSAELTVYVADSVSPGERQRMTHELTEADASK